MAAAPIYANVRDPERDAAIVAARARCTIDEVANQFNIGPGAVRAAVRRVKAAKSYTLFLVDTAGKRTSVGTIVTHRGFTAACVAAFRTYGEFFRGLEIPGWRLVDEDGGCNTLETVRKIASRTADLSAEPEVDLL